MNGELERYQERDAWIPVVKEIAELAKQLASTPFVGAFRGKPGDVFGAILYGHELHLAPLQALQALDSIDGKPTLKAEALRALYFREGHRLEVVEWTDKRCTVRAERRDGLSSVDATYTMNDAQVAGLAGKKNWRTAPRQMLYARATAMAIKAVAPDIALGIDTSDAPAEQPALPAGATTTAVQITASEPETIENPPETERKPDEKPSENLTENRSETEQETEPPEPLVTSAQLRKLNAQLGQLDILEGRRLGRDQRRELIAALAGAEGITSAKELTKDQASRAIESLNRAVAGAVQDQPGEDGAGHGR